MEKFTDISFLIMVFGILATVLSVITEITKKIGLLKKTLTELQVIVSSLILTPVTMLALAQYYKIKVEWFMVFASFVAAFVVAYVSMYGWEKLFGIYERMKGTQQAACRKSDHMEQIITMSVVLAVGVSVLIFLMKKQFNDVVEGIQTNRKATEETKRELTNRIKENDKKINDKIDRLEEYTRQEVGSLKQELSDIKGDFATAFVLREDFFRFGNGVEDKMKNMDNKLDKILFGLSERKG